MTISDYLCNPQQQNALSFNEIKDMLQEELDTLISICFHEGKLRTYEQGISNIRYNKKNNWFEISWEDEEGDNEAIVYSLDEKIHVNSDEWSYGIYKPSSESPISIEEYEKRLKQKLRESNLNQIGI